MVDEIKVEQTQEIKGQEAKTEVTQKKQEQVIVPEPQIDFSVFDSMRSELEALKREKGEDREVINKIKSAFSNNEDEFNDEKFVQEFVNNPTKALDKYLQTKTKGEREELEQLKKDLKQTKLLNEDSRQLSEIKASDSDYGMVMANVGRVINEQEFADLHERLADNPNRNEIIYNTIKARVMKLEDVKKQATENATNKAKEEINNKARTLQPISGTFETRTPDDERRERISKAKENWDVDKVLDEVIDGDWSKLFLSRTNR
jgi:hypothetical protein